MKGGLGVLHKSYVGYGNTDLMIFPFHISDSTTYAHFLFNAFDTDHNGAVSFEVSPRLALT